MKNEIENGNVFSGCLAAVAVPALSYYSLSSYLSL